MNMQTVGSFASLLLSKDTNEHHAIAHEKQLENIQERKKYILYAKLRLFNARPPQPRTRSLKYVGIQQRAR